MKKTKLKKLAEEIIVERLEEISCGCAACRNKADALIMILDKLEKSGGKK